MKELDGKSAIITGAGDGIGRAGVLEFLAQGADVVAVDLDGHGLRETEEAARAARHAIVTVIADVSDPADVRRYLQAAIDELGRVDVLWNNAGIECFTTRSSTRPSTTSIARCESTCARCSSACRPRFPE